MNQPVTVVQYGMGPIGCLVARLVAVRPDMRLVGAVDADPHKVGRDVGDVASLGRPLGVDVRPDAGPLLASLRPTLVFHSTGSLLDDVGPQIEAVCRAGANVVSSCEELSYPWVRNRGWAERIDAAARQGGVTVLGTGINPGFAMDLMLITVTGMCRDVRGVSARRVVNASKRRHALQRKIGAGLTVERFQQMVQAGKVRHVGLPESVDMVAAALGWRLTRVDDEIAPVVAQQPVETEHLRVEAGQVAGVRQTAVGWEGELKRLSLELEMYVGAPEPGDYLSVDGDPPVSVSIDGIHGDVSTAAIMVNAASFVAAAPPGLTTMTQLPTVCWRAPFA
jgi:4-hydroxy-tetrahydrodipicolinate reductase